MRIIWILVSPLLFVGCATHGTIAVQSPLLAPPVAIPVAAPSDLVETRYDVRGYREAANPAIRHQPHTVFRSTRIANNATRDLETVPRTNFPPASYAPLPPSDELKAELATQKKITGELRALQSSLAETEQRMQAQYAALIRQSAEAIKLRERLEAERSRLRPATPVKVPVAPAAPVAGESSQVKW